LYTADPHTDASAQLLQRVEEITPDIEAMTGGAGSKLGTGGMHTKLHAARLAMEAGIPMVIANGQEPSILYDIVAGKPVGTRFVSKGAKG
ncbi:MAG: glutamate 5-kinase, partial [Loktanella sp.]|nr:glutamate 5-kinase [Loktanella sp.]